MINLPKDFNQKYWIQSVKGWQLKPTPIEKLPIVERFLLCSYLAGSAMEDIFNNVESVQVFTSYIGVFFACRYDQFLEGELILEFTTENAEHWQTLMNSIAGVAERALQ